MEKLAPLIAVRISAMVKPCDVKEETHLHGVLSSLSRHKPSEAKRSEWIVGLPLRAENQLEIEASSHHGSPGIIGSGKSLLLLQSHLRKETAVMMKDPRFLSSNLYPTFCYPNGQSHLYMYPDISLKRHLHLRVHRRLTRISACDTISDSPKDEDLKVGSPIIIIEAPPILKTAEPMPMLRANSGLIRPGDAGRIISRRPKDVWAVRLAVGAYLIDRKYFKPLHI